MGKTLFKAYSGTVIHTSLPCKYVFVNLLFGHYLLVEGSHYFNIPSLVVCIGFLGVDFDDIWEAASEPQTRYRVTERH